MKTTVIILITAVAFSSHGHIGVTSSGIERPVPDWSYKILERHSTHVVLAVPIDIRDAKPADKFNPPAEYKERYKGVITKFKVLASVKGSIAESEISIPHFLEAPVNGMLLGNGPQFVSFRKHLANPKDAHLEEKPVFMLFLRNQRPTSPKNAHYVEFPFEFVTGNKDPVYSIRRVARMPMADAHWPDDR